MDPKGIVSIVSGGDTNSVMIKAEKAGTVKLKHTRKSWRGSSSSDTFTITVVAIPVAGITINNGSDPVGDTLALSTGDTAELTAVIAPDNATNKEVTWESSDPEVVSVDNGTLTALKAGEATITVAAKDDSGVNAKVRVTVADVDVESVAVAGEANQAVYENGKIQLAVTFTPENATNKGLKWESDNLEIATVDENGIVTGVKAGTTTITATSVGNSDAVATFTVTVEEIYMTEFSVVADRTTVTVGDTVNVRAIIKPDEYPNKEVTWKSLNETVATVDENGVVTTKATGPVTIQGTSKADPDSSATVTILVEDVKAESVTISGYNRDYLTTGNTVNLTATVLPVNAADKKITWSSSNTDVVEVDENGKVTAKGQGTATVRALNEDTGLYDEVEITVYASQPQTVTVRVWVTNQLKSATVSIYLPSDGTPVTLADVLPTYVSSGSDDFVYCGPVYIHNYNNGASWQDNIIKSDVAVRLRYSSNQIQYSKEASGDSWINLRLNGTTRRVNAQYELLYSGNEEDDTDINVVLGDWPYGADHAATKKVLQIRIYNSETGECDYDSGRMYYDNGADGTYGKIKFNCDESRYEVSEIVVERYSSANSTTPVSKTTATQPVSVAFNGGSNNYQRYIVTATVRAKEFTVHYDSNGGSNDVPADQKIKAINGNTVTVASSPQPTRAGYIFAGWSYGGKTYFGGETFEMPASNVTFVANWIEASQAINYRSDNTSMGTVTRAYERVNSSTQATDLKGSMAEAKEGYRFVKWIDEKGTTVHELPFYRPTKADPATYTAVFEEQSYNITTSVTNGTITESQKVSYNGSATITYSPDAGYKLKSVTVDGEDMTAKYPSSYTFSKVKADHTITVVYEKDESKWNDIIYTTEDLDNVTGMPEGETDVLAGTEQTVSTAEPTRAGYDFKGWTTTDVTVTADKFVMPEKDVTFTAQWEAIDVKYTVEYYYEDGGKYPDEATKTDNTRMAKTGTTVQVTDADKIPDATYKDGKYAFDTSAANVLSGTVAGDGSLVLKVYFKEASGVVRYNLTLAGATISGDGLTHDTGNIWKVANQYYEYPDTFTVTSAVPTCEGYVFVGWFDKARTSGNGNTNAAFRNAGETITYLYDATKDNNTYTLDAVWVKISADDKTVTYDGNAHSIDLADLEFVSGDLDDAYIKQIQGLNKVKLSEVLYKGPDAEEYTAAAPEYTDAGTYPIQIKGTVNVGSNSYELTTSATLTIERKAVVVTADNKTKAYGADDPEFTATADGLPNGDSLEYTLNRESGNDVGTYTITPSGETVQGNYEVTYKTGTLKIEKAERAEFTVKDYTGTYDGAAHTISVEGTVDGDMIEYSYDGGNTWVTKLNTYTNVSETPVQIQVKVTNDNYQPSEVIKVGYVTINPFKVQVKADNKTKKYGDADPDFTVSVTSLEEGKEKPNDGYTISYDSIFVRQPGETVGSYTIYAGGNTKQGNYEVSYANGTLTIEQAARPVDLSVASYEGIYDGADHSIVVNNLQTGDQVQYSYDGGESWTDELNRYTDVTSQEIIVRVTNRNYTETTVDLDGHVTITQKEVKVTANSASKVYGTDDPDFTATVSGTINGETVAYTLSREDGEDAGTYDIYVSAEADQGNYHVTTVDGLFTIIPADREQAVAVRPYSGEYDGIAHTITVTGTVDGDQVEYSYDGGENWEDELREYTDVTTEPVKIQVRVTNDNYESIGVLESSVYIWAKAVTVTGINVNGR